MGGLESYSLGQGTSRDTHDYIGLGEDDPAHQPVEQLTALRSTPNLKTWRPCDAPPEAIIITTGSEVELATAAKRLSGRKVRVVSIPCAEAFSAQSAEYRCLPTCAPRGGRSCAQGLLVQVRRL
ncbi:transketolase [Microbulbifer hydrolyticus]|uniref:Transketolase n=1 Tax=Microbulbifer hydrolyticus TaxID=48074 RepID=A0AA89PBP4_9GAMM|nr:transketolase [Microbulbifer hydrolyticus]